MSLWAVHISDGILTTEVTLLGFVLAGALALVGLFRLREEEVPRIALLTAAFFIVSLIHIRIGPTSVHLLLSGLLGVILGRKVALAIPLGLTLQMILVAHGGFSTIGVNSCVLVLPALLIGALFRRLYRQEWTSRASIRSVILGMSLLLWLLGLVFSVALLVTNADRNGELRLDSAKDVTNHPITIASILLLAGFLVWHDRRRRLVPEHTLGLLLGIVAVMLSATLNTLVLLYGGLASMKVPALAVLVVHLPIAVLEGVILSFTVAFLAKVKPELLGLESSETPTVPTFTGESTCAPASSSSV